MLPLGHASEAGEIAMTSLDANALIEDVRGLQFLAQTLGSGTARPDMASRFGTKSRSSVRRSPNAKVQVTVGDRTRLTAISELI